MYSVKKYHKTFIALIAVLLFMFFINISLGSVHIPFNDVFGALFYGTIENENWQFIITNFRLPKAITAFIVGSGLSVAGLLMQTLFRNPLAGPFVLGISSGASLGVAMLVFGVHLLGGLSIVFSTSSYSLAIAASLGSFAVMSIIMFVAKKIRNTMSILIVGLMFASFASAFISILAYFGTAEQLQQFMFWGFGSLSNLGWNELLLLGIVYLLSLLAVLSIIKPLNSFLLGENYAKSLGVNITKTRNIILIAASLLTGIITALVGPIAFIGLAVPHITKLVFTTSNHKILIPAVAIIGGIILLICDLISQVPFSDNLLPINAITSIFGAPIVIWLLIKKRTLLF